VTRAVTLLAPAKINLALAVTGKREDGYHDLRSVFATIDLADRVRVAPSQKLEVRIAPDVGAPRGDDLASRAVRRRDRSRRRGVRADPEASAGRSGSGRGFERRGRSHPRARGDLATC
jgi:4-diphosphocytidyl-2C-methyl-D-erythritol kinase